MGGLCSRQSTESSPSMGGFPLFRGYFNYASEIIYESRGLTEQYNVDETKPPSREGKEDKLLREPFTFPKVNANAYGMTEDDVYDGIPRLSTVVSNRSISTKSKQLAVAKVSEMSYLLGRAGTAGLGKAVDVLDTLGSSMTNLNVNGGFVSGVGTKGNKISILAFEVANTIVKGANLMQSISKENIKRLKEVVLPSEGVRSLISRDMDELLKLAAADKRDEWKVFSGEVVRFGNRCKDPQWHNLGRYFEKLGSEPAPQKQLLQVENVMQQLMASVQYTAELYHELHALDRLEQDCRRKAQEEDNSSTDPKGAGDCLSILKAELKSQKKLVKTLKKKSLWSKTMEEVTENLVDIVHLLHLEIHEAFGDGDGNAPIKTSHQKLGPAGLALHYATVISQIDTLVTRSSSVPLNLRNALYLGLPPTIKSTLLSKMKSFQVNEELTAQQIKAEMEKTLQWLVPLATNTTKAHHGFGWVGEWANTGPDVDGKAAGQDEFIRLETLHHAQKENTELYIFDLVVWLHFLIKQSRVVAANAGTRLPVKSSNHRSTTLLMSTQKSTSPYSTLTDEDQEMLKGVTKRKHRLIRSRSQEFDAAKSRLRKQHSHSHRLSRSNSLSSTFTSKRDAFSIRRPSSLRIIDFDIDRIKALDAIDRVNTL